MRVTISDAFVEKRESSFRNEVWHRRPSWNPFRRSWNVRVIFPNAPDADYTMRSTFPNTGWVYSAVVFLLLFFIEVVPGPPFFKVRFWRSGGWWEGEENLKGRLSKSFLKAC